MSTEITHESRPLSKGERTRARIVEAAAKLFSERGYAATSLRDVASAVELREPSLYNYFESKDALYAAVLGWGLSPLLDRLSTLAAASDVGLADPAAAMHELLADNQMVARLMLHEILRGCATAESPLGRWLASLVEAGVAASGDASSFLGSDEQERMLAILAMFNMSVGYFAVAHAFSSLTGVDLTNDDAHEKQQRLVERFTHTFARMQEEESR